MELARLVSRADDAAFAGGIGGIVDLDATARFLAAEVLLANFDGILCNGQNFLLWLDPRSNRFGFGPWDLDHSWGEFPMAGTSREREQTSISHPWIGPNRFLERLFAVEYFQARYRAELRRQLETLFVPERLFRRIDELAAAIRPALAEESTQRLGLFELAVGEPRERGPKDEPLDHERKPVHQLKRFIANRSREANAQLAGNSPGTVLTRNAW